MQATYNIGFPAKWMVLAPFLLSQVSLAQVDTYFADTHGTFSQLGESWYQEFSVSKNTTFVLRHTCDYEADAAIVTGSQLGNFINNRPFTGYAVFDNQFGTESVTLAPGTYYVGVRNQTSSSNTYRLELDYDINVPPEGNDSFKFVDTYITGSDYVDKNGGKLWHEFTVQSGYRYFLDGCNTGLSTYVIDDSDLASFTSGGTFSFYSAYSGTDNALPGLSEITLPPGTYYLAFINTAGIPKTATYSMERWKKIDGGGTGALDLSGPASWATAGTTVNIVAAKVSNSASGGKSGSLRLRLWAAKSKFSGGTLNGYIMGTRTLKPLTANHYYSNISGKVKYNRPPSGKYYTILTLEEYTNSGWVIRDYINFTGRKKL